ncbi:MAG: hypothetical protein ACT4R6_08590, partial [Gemmatimonadaceae bacterium]
MIARSLCLLLLVSAVPLSAQPSATPADEAYTVEYYYKARWGFADEFIRLFRKNHFPILQREMEKGRIVSVTGVTPRYHMTEAERWDYRVTIVFRSAAAAAAPSAVTDADRRQLYPDQAAFAREEQRRFEILLAHWDLPITRVVLT